MRFAFHGMLACSVLALVACGGSGETNTAGSTSATSGAGGGATTTSSTTGAGGAATSTTGTTTGAGGASGCSDGSECPSGLCEAGACKENLVAAFPWPGSKYDQRIARLADGAYFAAGGSEILDNVGHGLTATRASSDGSTVLASVDRGEPTSTQSAHILSVLALGTDVLVLDQHEGDDLDVGGGVVLPKSSAQVAAIRLGPDGVAKWATLLQGVVPWDSKTFTAQAAVDGAGHVWIDAMPSGASFTVDGAPVAASTHDPLILELDPNDGHLMGSHSVGAGGSCYFEALVDGGSKEPPRSAIVGTDDGVIVTGQAGGQCDFGGGAIPATAVPHSWGFVARLDANLQHVWSRAFPGGTAPNLLEGLGGPAVARAGTAVYVAGEMPEPIDFGAGLLDGNLGVVELDLATGATVWSRAFSGTPTYQTKVLAIAASGGRVALAGTTNAGEDFGVKDLGPGSGIYLLELHADGTPSWLRTFTPASAAEVRGLDVVGGGTFALYTHATGVDFGGGVLADSPSKLAVALFQLP